MGRQHEVDTTREVREDNLRKQTVGSRQEKATQADIQLEEGSRNRKLEASIRRQVARGTEQEADSRKLAVGTRQQ